MKSSTRSRRMLPLAQGLLVVEIVLVISVTALGQEPRSFEEPKSLKESNDCQSQLQKWKDWADKNVPKHNELLAEYDRLSKRNEELEAKVDKLEQKTDLGVVVAIGMFALGAGGYLAFLLVRFLKGLRKRIGQVSADRKQLVVLLFGAVCITFLLVIDTAAFGNHPVNALAAVLIHSLPVLLFGGIILWRLRKGQPKVA